MNTITGLCDRGIMLQGGSVLFDGSAPEAVLRYQTFGGKISGSSFDADGVRRTIGNDYARLHRAWTSNLSGEPASSFDLEEPIQVWMEYSVLKPGKLQTYPNFHFFDEKGDYFFVSAGITQENEVALNRPGRWLASCTVPGGLLNTGSFTVGVAVTTMNPGLQVAFFERDALMFQVTEDIQANLDTKRMGYAGPIPGTLRPTLPWTVEMVESPEAVAR
jgi:lipopolysaccharide transport system ATP-binding protein